MGEPAAGPWGAGGAQLPPRGVRVFEVPPAPSSVPSHVPDLPTRMSSLCQKSLWSLASFLHKTKLCEPLFEVKVAQSCPALCNPMNYTVLGILQAQILEWVAFPFSRGSSRRRDQTQVSHIAGGLFTI